MPPNYESYSSLLDGSFRIQSAKNSAKHGSGGCQIQNSIDLFGSDNQFVKSSNVSADLSVQSAKSLNLSSVATSHLTGQNVNLTSTSDSTLKCTTGAMIVEATAGDCTVKASSASTLYLAGKIKDESFNSTLCKSVADYTIKSSGANATLQADNLEARVFGHSLVHIRGNQATKLESTNGKVDIVGKTDIDIKAVNILNEATTKATVSAPEVDVNASVVAKVEAPLVELGLTSDNVNISALGKQTTVNGNCIIAGNSFVSTEDISLQGSTLIKGIGTAGSSALTIYDNDTTPNKLWDFLDNGKLNASNLPTISTGTVVGDVWSQNGTVKIGNPSANITTVASVGGLTVNADTTEVAKVLALATNITINAPTGTPNDNQSLWFRILDNGTSRTITLNAVFEDYTGNFPTSTTAGKYLIFAGKWNADEGKWNILAWKVQP